MRTKCIYLRIFVCLFINLYLFTLLFQRLILALNYFTSLQTISLTFVYSMQAILGA